MRPTLAEIERIGRVRLAGQVILALGLWLVLSAIALDFGQSAGAVSNGVFGSLIALLAVAVLRNPVGSVPLCWLIGLGGVVVAASPFFYGYPRYVLTTGNSLWAGLIVLLLAVFIIGEVLKLDQPLTALEPDTAPTPRAEPQD